MTDQVKLETGNINILWERETSINLGVMGVGVESLEQYELLYKFLNYSCHGSIYRCLILHLQNSKLQIKKITNSKYEMHYCSAESYAVKTSLENILHMPHDSLPSAHFDLFGKERSITIRGYIAYNSFLSDFANNSKDPKKMKIL